jgi:hypothetical protein
MHKLFEVNDAKYAELEVLMAEGEMTAKDFLNVAFTLITWAIRQIKQDRQIASIDEPNNRYSELQMVELERYRPKPAD